MDFKITGHKHQKGRWAGERSGVAGLWGWRTGSGRGGGRQIGRGGLRDVVVRRTGPSK